MIRLAAIAALLCVSAAPAFAQDFDVLEGFYSGTSQGSELTATLTHVENGVYSAALSTTVPMKNDVPGCGGSIEGEVVIRDNVGLLTAPNELYDATSTLPAFKAEQCQIKLEFDGEYGLVVTEEEGCSYYHGASCSFSGELLHDAAGI
ncbi:hypothetical protein WH87_04310 [Devosia epidermidihirudinis]|uniref:Uncharacterized protein n=1 Tax=Devosia epidermidihirudinis TaxID=1293439 RepID=A0A0F5QEQ7_9HYPH|nr:hypothetical protein [Devosia epidermidihirudinis]KKC39440.1 hypothetical protein WH87_04310 [Devosia epidermidihirudinis]